MGLTVDRQSDIHSSSEHMSEDTLDYRNNLIRLCKNLNCYDSRNHREET